MDIISATLPESKTYATRGCHFIAETLFDGVLSRFFVAGRLTVTQGANTKDIATYRVVEFPTSIPGRAFRLVKVAGGSDREADHYDVLIDPHGHDICECRGFLRHGHCKHVDSIRALLAVGAFEPACPTCANHGFVPTANLDAAPCPTCQQAPAPIPATAVVAA
jgi:hypothetical protein